MVYPRQSIHRNSLKYPFQMSTWTFIKCFSISFVVYHRTKSLSLEKFTNICVFGEIIPFLSHLCLSFALHAISAVLKLLTSSYKLSASLQDLFPYCTLKLCHVLSSIAIRLLLVDVASLFLLYWTSNCQQKRVGDVCFCSKLFVCGEWVKCQRYQRLFSMCD